MCSSDLSHGHGADGPIQVVPLAFEAWRTATGENLFLAGKPWSYLNEMSRWLVLLQLPHNGRQAFIDDGGGGEDSGFGVVAPFVARALRDPLAQWCADQAEARGIGRWAPWQRVVGYDPTLKAQSPGEAKLTLGYLLVGLAGTLGAPFWFDLLNKFMVVRSTVKPREKSREEEAKD